jgi:hypothetical protein
VVEDAHSPEPPASVPPLLEPPELDELDELDAPELEAPELDDEPPLEPLELLDAPELLEKPLLLEAPLEPLELLLVPLLPFCELAEPPSSMGPDPAAEHATRPIETSARTMPLVFCMRERVAESRPRRIGHFRTTTVRVFRRVFTKPDTRPDHAHHAGVVPQPALAEG